MNEPILWQIAGALNHWVIFGPTLFFLMGITALWIQIVWLGGYNVVSSSLWLKSLGSYRTVGPFKRFWYYYDSRRFDNRFAGSIIKGNLLAILLITLVAELLMNSSVLSGVGATDYFSGMLNHSMLTYCMKLAVLFFALATVTYVDPYEPGMSTSTLGLVAAIVFFSLILVSSAHLIVLYVSLEGISLLAFVLAAYTKTSTAVESGVKYFLQSSFASVILLLGIATIFIGTQEFGFMAIRYELLEQPLTSLTSAGFMLVTIAFLFKVSSFPGHFWGPDVYRGPLTSIVNVFAVGIKLAAFCGLILVHTNFLVFSSFEINWMLYIASAASLVIGMVGALRTINSDGDIRAFLAYTSINQVGFILLGLVCVTLEGLLSSLVYLSTYLLASTLFIGVISRIRYATDKGTVGFTKFSDFKHLYSGQHKFSRRLDSFILAFAVWSMAGLPPFAGFVGKLAVWTALYHRVNDFLTGRGWTEIKHAFQFVELETLNDPVYAYAGLLILSVVVSLISATYYFKIYELMSPAAANSAVSGHVKEPIVHMVHDNGSLVVTVVLGVLITIWIVTVTWQYGALPMAFPKSALDLGGHCMPTNWPL